MIDDADWDDLVAKTYGKPYSFQQQDGCRDRGILEITVPDPAPFDFKRDTIPEKINGNIMGVSFKAWLARDPQEWNGDPDDESSVDLFWERNFYPDISVIANDLHEKGLIPAGTFVINIDW
jgi:hypothetical protein